MLAVFTPKKRPMSVRSALPRSSVRYTCTRTRLFTPAGDVGNVTSAGCTLTCWLMTWLLRDAVSAFCTAGPLALRLS